MTSFKFFILLVLIVFSGITGCRKKVDKKVLIDVTKPNRISFNGMRGDKVYMKIKGTFSGRIKVAFVSNSNKVTDGDFAVFQDSVNIEIGTLNIYQDNSGFSFLVKPVDATKGKVFVTMIEYRNFSLF